MSEQASITTAGSVGYDPTHQDWFDSKKVCDKCQEIFDHWYARYDWSSERPDHEHHTWHDLQESARDCPICELWMVGFLTDDSTGQSHQEVINAADPLERGVVRVLDQETDHSFSCILEFTSATSTSSLLESQIDVYDGGEYLFPSY